MSHTKKRKKCARQMEQPWEGLVVEVWLRFKEPRILNMAEA